MDDDTTADPATEFDANRYLTHIGGKPYLEVRWRILWLRSVAPDARIRTRLVSDDGKRAVFRATVSIPGAGSATGYGSETEGDFHDYLEKSETKAIGRALGALGYGTQFCDDHAGEGSAGRPVDAPTFQPRRGGAPDPATERQIKAIYGVGAAANLSTAEIARLSGERYGSSPEGLSRRQASDFIDLLKAQAGEPPQQTAPSPTRAAVAAVVDEARIYAPVAQQGARASDNYVGQFWEAVAKLGQTDREQVERACGDISGGKAVRDLSAIGLREFHRLWAEGRIGQGADGRYAVTPIPEVAPVGR